MKHIFSLLLLLCITGSVVLGQPVENDPNVTTIDGRHYKKLVTISNPKQDETHQFEISGAGTTVFSTSNVADGTVNTYKHNQQITVSLVPADKSKGEFQVIFYSDPKEVPQTANYTDKKVAVYYPIQLYESIKEKLDQAFSARKKVYVKVVQKTNGFREGSLIL
jgi:hypothetical protein